VGEEWRDHDQENQSAVPDALRMRRLLYGHLLSRVLCSMAALGIPDLIGDGGRSVADLARETTCHPPSLHQAMRALTSFGVFREEADGTFGLTPLGATLRRDAPASARHTALLVGNEVGNAWNQFEMTVRTGRTAFSALFGTDFFSYGNLKPELRAVFDSSQAAGLELDLEHITAGLDLSCHQLIVDVGGGDGALLVHLLEAYPHLRGLVFDLPRVTAKARRRLADAELTDRCAVRSGDFFGTIPPDGDLYLLRQILHDWDDEHCRALLRNCRDAMSPGAKLMIIELLAEKRDHTGLAGEMTALMDLYMLSIFDGKERTRAEFIQLLTDCGFAMCEVRMLAPTLAAITAVPV
jgi:hypothetical protein